MSNLKTSLVSVKVTLDEACNYLVNRDRTLLSDLEKTWVDHWCAKLERRVCLENILKDIDYRGIACRALYDFPLNADGLSTSIEPPARIPYGHTPLRPELARHIFVASYLSLTWSVYDYLYDFFTRITGSSEITDNQEPKKNKKLKELFEGDNGRCFVCYGHDGLYRRKLAWVYKVSYVIRNAFMHEGGRIKGNAILDGTSSSTFFNITEETKAYFQGIYNINSPQFQHCVMNQAHLSTESSSVSRLQSVVSRNSFPWFDGDIRTILTKYNAYLDDMFARMIVWSANSLVAQIESMLNVSSGISLAKVV